MAKLGCGLRIVIVGDNDFYSQRLQLQERNLPTTMSSLRSLPPFCKTSTTLTNVHKTGLGSSAALITSLVAAIFVHFRAVTSLDDEADRVLVHNTAQQAHCLAQGKVGSGFDVSAAVWGSHRYRRFDPNVLEPAMVRKVSGIPTCLQMWAHKNLYRMSKSIARHYTVLSRHQILHGITSSLQSSCLLAYA